MIDDETQLLLDEKQDEILTGMPVPRDGKIGDIRTNVIHKGKFYQTMKTGVDAHFFSAPFTRTPSIHTMEDYLLKSGGKMLDKSLLDAYDVTVRNDILLSGLSAGVDNTVLVLNSANKVVTDEIDLRVWGSSLVDYAGSPLVSQISVFVDTDTIQGYSGFTFDNVTGNVSIPGDCLLTNGNYIGISAAERLEFYTAGYAAFMGCNVGIGTATPLKTFHIYNALGFNTQFRIERSGQGYYDLSPSADRLIFIDDDGNNNVSFGSVNGSFPEIVFNEGGVDLDFRVESDANTHALFVEGSSGNVGIGITAPLAKLHIDQETDDAAIPVVILDQADISEGFINFIGSDRGVITGATDSLESVRVEINGVVRRLALYVDA